MSFIASLPRHPRPTIAIPGEFGIRLEDCLYIGEDGPHFFSKPSKSIDEPFG